MDVTEGGSSIPYWMEDDVIREEYAEMLKTNGVENRMKPEWYETPAEFKDWKKPR
jgi:hypothetical protein